VNGQNLLFSLAGYCRNITKNEQNYQFWRSGYYTNYGLFSSAVSTLQTLVVALGAGLAVWGVINLLEGYGSDNPGAKSQGMKQLMAGGGVILLGMTLVPMLSTLF